MENTNVKKELTDIEQKAYELEKTFSYDGYQVVRKELFSHLRDPAIVIRPDGISFNTACIKGLADTVYINIMVNPDKRHMIVVKSGEDKKDSLRWCVVKEDIRKSRKITSPLFSGMIYTMMGWDTKYRYKILGYRIHAEGEEIFIFDLNDREMFLEGIKKPRRKELAEGEGTGIKLVEKKTRSKGYLPGEWQKSFGLPPDEHEEALNIDNLGDFISPEQLSLVKEGEI